MKALSRIFVAAACALLMTSTALGQSRAYLDQELSGWADPHLVVDGKIYDMGAWIPYYGIDELFEDNAEAQKFAKLHVKHARHAAWGFWGSIAVYAVAAVAANNVEDTTDQTNIMLGGSAAFLGGLIYGGYQANLSRAYLLKAINSYNNVDAASENKDLSRNERVPTLGLTFSF